MRIEAATGPPLVAVERGFEGNRLAKGLQVRAYEQVLALLAPTTTPTSEQAARQKERVTISGGIAA